MKTLSIIISFALCFMLIKPVKAEELTSDTEEKNNGTITSKKPVNTTILNYVDKQEVDIKPGLMDIKGIAIPKTDVFVNLNYKIPDLVDVKEKPAENGESNNKIALDFYNPLDKGMVNELVAIATHTGTVKFNKSGTSGVNCSSIADIGLTNIEAKFIFLDVLYDEGKEADIYKCSPDDGSNIMVFNPSLSNKIFEEGEENNSDLLPLSEEKKAKLKEFKDNLGSSSYIVKKNDIIYLNACRSYSRGDFTKIADKITWSPTIDANKIIKIDEAWKDAPDLIARSSIINLDKDKVSNTIDASGFGKFEATLNAKNKCILEIKVLADFSQKFTAKINDGADNLEMQINVTVDDDKGIDQKELEKAKIAVPHQIEWKDLVFNLNDFKTFLADEDVKDIVKIKVTLKGENKKDEEKKDEDGESDTKDTELLSIDIDKGKFFSDDPTKSKLEFSNPGLYHVELFDSSGKVIPNLDFYLNIPWFDMDESKMIVWSQPSIDYSNSEYLTLGENDIEEDTKFKQSMNIKNIYTVDALSKIKDLNFKADKKDGIVDLSTARYWLPVDEITEAIVSENNGIVDHYISLYFINNVKMKEKDKEVTTTKYFITAKKDIKISNKTEKSDDTAINFFINQVQASTNTLDIEVSTDKPKFINVANEIINTGENNDVNTQYDAKLKIAKPFFPIDAEYQIDAFYFTDEEVKNNEKTVRVYSVKIEPIILYQKYPELANEMKSDFEKKVQAPAQGNPGYNPGVACTPDS